MTITLLEKKIDFNKNWEKLSVFKSLQDEKSIKLGKPKGRPHLHLDLIKMIF